MMRIYMEDRNQETCDGSWRILELNIEMPIWRDVIIFIAILEKQQTCDGVLCSSYYCKELLIQISYKYSHFTFFESLNRSASIDFSLAVLCLHSYLLSHPLAWFLRCLSCLSSLLWSAMSLWLMICFLLLLESLDLLRIFFAVSCSSLFYGFI